MDPATPEAIEEWLYAQDGWVSRDCLCATFDITERDLRPRGDRPGLLDGFAISRYEGGYIHVDHATEAEFGDFVNRIREHGHKEINKAADYIRQRLAGPRRQLVQSSLL